MPVSNLIERLENLTGRKVLLAESVFPDNETVQRMADALGKDISTVKKQLFIALQLWSEDKKVSLRFKKRDHSRGTKTQFHQRYDFGQSLKQVLQQHEDFFLKTYGLSDVPDKEFWSDPKIIDALDQLDPQFLQDALRKVTSWDDDEFSTTERVEVAVEHVKTAYGYYASVEMITANHKMWNKEAEKKYPMQSIHIGNFKRNQPGYKVDYSKFDLSKLHPKTKHNIESVASIHGIKWKEIYFLATLRTSGFEAERIVWSIVVIGTDRDGEKWIFDRRETTNKQAGQTKLYRGGFDPRAVSKVIDN